MPARRPRLYHYTGTGKRGIGLALDGKLAEDDFGFSLEVDGIAPVDLHFHFGELERVLAKTERIMPEPLRVLSWLEQVEGVVRELEAAGDDEQKRKTLAATALYLAQTCPTEARPACCVSKTMLEREREQHFDIGRVYLFMKIDADGGVDVNLFDQGWFDGDDWMLDNRLNDVDLGKLLNWKPTFH